jgi:hypothetical protein
MPNFKVASRTPDELVSHKAELDEMFAKVKGSNGRIDVAGMKEIENSKYEIAQLVIQLISDEATLSDPTAFFVDTVQGDIRDSYVYQELHPDAALRVVNRALGSKPLTQRLFFKEFGISTSQKEIAVAIPLEDIAAGRITASLVVARMAAAINRYRVGMILNAIDAGTTAGADQTGVAGYTRRYVGLTAANLDKAIDGLQDDSEMPTIFGRHIYMAPAIRGFAGWATTGSDAALREFETRGVIGTYNGAKVVTLQDQYSRPDAGHVIQSDRVYIAGGRKGAIYMQKDVSYLNYSLVDARTATFETGLRMEEGVLVWNPDRYRMITAT